MQSGAGNTPKAYGFVSPILWVFNIKPYVDLQIFPLILLSIFAVLMIGLSFIIESSRNFGSSLIQPMPGRQSASNLLKGYTSLKIKLTKGIFLGQFITIVFLAAVYGSFVTTIVNMVGKEPEIQKMFASLGIDQATCEFIEIFTGMIMSFFILIISIQNISVISRIFAKDEQNEITDILYSYPLSRNKVLFGSAFVGVLYSVISTLGASAVYGFLAHKQMWNIKFEDVIILGLVRSAIPIFFVCLAVFLTSINAKFIVYTYVYFGYCALGTSLAEILHLPNWAQNLSVLTHFSTYPVEAKDVRAMVIVLGLSIVLLIFAKFIYTKRNIR
jgi:ABC-2 type transport system permease protein